MQTYVDNLLTKHKGTTDNALCTLRSALENMALPMKPCSIKEARNAAIKGRGLVEHAEMEQDDLDLLKKIKATSFSGALRMPWYSSTRKQCTGPSFVYFPMQPLYATGARPQTGQQLHKQMPSNLKRKAD